MKNRRLITFLFSCTLICGAVAAENRQAPSTGISSNNIQPQEILGAISRAIPEMKSNLEQDEKKQPTPFFQKADLNYESVTCDWMRELRHPISNPNPVLIRVALCANENGKIKSLIKETRSSTQKVLPVLERQIPTLDPVKMGWLSEEEKIGQRTYHYFPIIIIGHGLFTIYSGVLVNDLDGTSIVVQLDSYAMCSSSARGPNWPEICKNPKSYIRKIAFAIETAVGK